MGIFSDDIKIVQVRDIEKLNSNLATLVNEKYNKLGRNLDFNELIKVSFYDEGSHIKFETLDQISVIVAADSADGPYNKIE